MASKLIQKQVSIIGGGPVGQTAAYLLEKAGISYALIEKQNAIKQHPAAHLINLRSMEIFKECGLEQPILDKTENINNFRYYRYMKRLLDSKENQFAIHDHFSPSPEEKLREIRTQTFSNYVHLPQCTLSEVLYQNNQVANQNYHLGCQVESISNPNFFQNNEEKSKVELKVKNNISGQYETFQSDYLLACDGFHSFIRKDQGVQMIGQHNIQSFLNIFFHSKKLADLLQEKDQNAMLHFLYNSDIIACLVNHTKSSGMFVLQIPIYPPFSNLVDLDYSKDPKIRERQSIEIINKLIANEYQLQDSEIEIKNVGMWNLSAVQIEKYFKNRILFAGDSAHSFPPAGGFGMNTGIQEVHNLVHKLRMIFDPKIQNDDQKKLHILNNYHQERQQYCSFIINETMVEYRKSIEVAKRLGLSLNNLNLAKNFFKKLPLPITTAQSMWSKLMKVGTYHLELDHNKFKKRENLEYIKNTENLIPMMFYDHDVNYGYSNGFIQEDKKVYNSLVGQLMPHFYVKLSNAFGEKTISTREMAVYLEQNSYIENLENFKSNIIYQDNQDLSYRKFFMIALYFDPKWKQANIEKLVEQMQFEPNFIFGFQLEKENSETNNNSQNIIQSYNHDLHEENILTQDMINEYDQLLDKKIHEIFVKGNEMVLMRSDGHVYSIYDYEELELL